MPQKPDIQQTLVEFLRGESPAGIVLEPQTDLIETGLLDSLLIMDLMAFVESSFSVRLQAADVSPRHFGSVAALAELIASRTAQRSSAA